MTWLSIICQAASLAKLISAAFGWQFADPILDELSNICAAVVAPATSVQLAKSDTFVK